MAEYFDVSIAGSMAVMIGVVFLLVFVFAPKRGLVTILRRRKGQKFEFAEKILLFHVYNHEGDNDEDIVLGVNTIQHHVNWEESFFNKIIKNLKKNDKIYIEDEIIRLTEEGREFTMKSYKEIVLDS